MNYQAGKMYVFKFEAMRGAAPPDTKAVLMEELQDSVKVNVDGVIAVWPKNMIRAIVPIGVGGRRRKGTTRKTRRKSHRKSRRAYRK